MPVPNLTPIKNPTPRERFRESGDNISKNRNLVDSPEFQRCIDFSLLEYQVLLSRQITDGNSSMANGFKLQGALEIVNVMRNLAETAPAVQKVVNQQLDHNV